MAGGILPGFFFEVRQVVMLVSDESGDLGLRGSLAYVVLMLLIRDESHAPVIMDIANRLSEKFFHHPLRKWNSLEGKHKRDVAALSAFIAQMRRQILSAVGFPLLATAVLLDKRLITKQKSPKLYDDASFRMGWCYGLMLKRVGWLLHKAGWDARWVVDRNSASLMRNLLNYSTRLPIFSGFKRRYSEPRFCSPKDQPILTLADFLAGLTRRCFESFLQANTTVPFAYQTVWDELKGIFHQTLTLPTGQQWRWEGLLYWPVDQRSQVKSFLAYP